MTTLELIHYPQFANSPFSKYAWIRGVLTNMSAANERARAIAILKEARDILADRLTERIVERGEEFLDDAMGRTFTSEIDSIYDQIGLRLNHVNVMISSLPAVEE